MSIARHPSVVTLPAAQRSCATVLAYLVRAFPHVSPGEWAQRLRQGKVTDERGRAIRAQSAYRAGARIFYFREVAHEPAIPFAEQIVFRNDEILVADKPHFLPVTPGGDFVEECLLNRLRRRTGLADLAPLHRLDRDTAGLVLFSVNRRTRGLYHRLFLHTQVEKTYEALAALEHAPSRCAWMVENRIERGEPRFRMRIVPGVANARSVIRLVEARGQRARFRLHPLTGKTHQLRLHMSDLGFPILNDRAYPQLLAGCADDFDRPLQLIARRLSFRDPRTGDALSFESAHELRW